jgi:hypothetical protein
MNQAQLDRELADLRLLRQQGQISPREAYERHLALLGNATVAPPPAVVAVEVAAAPVPVPYGRPGPGLHVLALLFALIGGAFGIIGAIFQETYAGGGVFLAFTGAPIIEEALKPAGVYLLLLRWHHALAGRLHVALLSSLGGLCFGLIESLVYVAVYYPEGGDGFVAFRFTVPVAMHTIASFLVGLGLSRGIIDWAAGRARFPRRTRNFYLAAVVLHAGYNLTVVILSLSGYLQFAE